MPTASSSVELALRDVLEIWLALVEQFLASPSSGEQLHPLGALSLAVYLLNLDRSTLTDDNESLLRLVDASALGQCDVRAALETLRTSDPHLAAACRSPWEMASALQYLGLDALSHSLTPSSPKPDLNQLTTEVMQQLFEEESSRGALSSLQRRSPGRGYPACTEPRVDREAVPA